MSYHQFKGKKRWLVAVTAMFWICFLFFSCKNPSMVYIDAYLPLTGAGKDIGVEIQDGISLAVEQINNEGGIRNRFLAVNVYDTRTDADYAVGLFEKQLNHPPVISLSCLSAVSKAIAPIAETRHRMLLSLVTSAPEVTLNRKWVYRYWPTAENEAQAFDLLLNRIRPETLTLLYVNDEYGRSVSRTIHTISQKYPVELKEFAYDTENPSFPDLQAAVQGAQAVLIIGFPSHFKTLIKELRRISYPGFILANSAATSPDIRQMQETEGVYVISSAIFNDYYKYADEVKKKFETEFMRPFNQYAANGYDAVMMVAGIMQEKGIDPDQVKEMFEGGFIYSGVHGTVKIRPESQDIMFPHYAGKIENKKIVFLK